MLTILFEFYYLLFLLILLLFCHFKMHISSLGLHQQIPDSTKVIENASVSKNSINVI